MSYLRLCNLPLENVCKAASYTIRVPPSHCMGFPLDTQDESNSFHGGERRRVGGNIMGPRQWIIFVLS